MVTSYSSSIVMMISTRSSDVTPRSDRTESVLTADGSKWACFAITLLSTSLIVSPMLSRRCCLFGLKWIDDDRLAVAQSRHKPPYAPHQFQIFHRLGAWHGWIPNVDGPGRDVGANAGCAAHHGPSADFEVVGNPHTPSENHAVADDHATC